MLSSEIVISALPPQTERVFIAYSGGVDSHVLLHLATTSGIKSKITAVYVNHGLQNEANLWAQHCKEVSRALGLNFICLDVNAQKSNRQSPEEVARDARYTALKTLLAENDVLLVGQHREDQMESVLLQLFRGAGVKGLSGMPLLADFGLGVLCRPLLERAKQEIQHYAVDHGLSWIEDPSNKRDDFDRNYLRNTILPQLTQRWPSLDKTIARSARHCASVDRITQDLGNDLLSRLYQKEDRTLIISFLLELDINKQHLVIRQWFSYLQLRMPSEKILQRILSEVVLAKSSGNPEVQVGGYLIKRYRNKLYCLILRPKEDFAEQQWSVEQSFLKLNESQQLELVVSDTGILNSIWSDSTISVRYRKSAEKIRLPGREGRHTLKKLFQESGIPPWERNKIPLIYINNKLAVITGLWLSADFMSHKKGQCYQVSWAKI